MPEKAWKHRTVLYQGALPIPSSATTSPTPPRATPRTGAVRRAAHSSELSEATTSQRTTASSHQNGVGRASRAGAPTPSSEDRLRDAAVSALGDALSQARARNVALWLFDRPTQNFHSTPLVALSAFDSAVVIHAVQQITGGGRRRGARHTDGPFGSPPVLGPAAQTTQASPAGSSASRDEPRSAARPSGSIVLLVPVKEVSEVTTDGLAQKCTLGYTFGALSGTTDFSATYPLGRDSDVFFPHSVGRFSFNRTTNDLVVLSHGLPLDSIGVVSIRMSADGHHFRKSFVVPGGEYNFRRLPSRVRAMTEGHEVRSRKHLPVYQFPLFSDRSASSHASSSARDTMGEGERSRSAMARLERVVKGTFSSEKMTRDCMDQRSGEVSDRRTHKVTSRFDVVDAALLRLLRDRAVRLYLSDMSRSS